MHLYSSRAQAVFSGEYRERINQFKIVIKPSASPLSVFRIDGSLLICFSLIFGLENYFHIITVNTSANIMLNEYRDKALSV